MAIKAGENIIRECTPEQDDAAMTAGLRIEKMGKLMASYAPGYRFMLNIDAIRDELNHQMGFVEAAAKADTPQRRA